MKNIARLVLFFTVSFAIVFLGALLLGIISSWIDMARVIPAESRPGDSMAELAWKSLSAAIYLATLLSLSYTARKNLPNSLSIICVLLICSVFTAGLSIGIGRAETLEPALDPVTPIRAGPGLILSRSETTVVLLKESTDSRGPRVVSFPGRPLIYQEAPLGPNNSILPLPPLPLGSELPWFIRSMGIDFRLCAEQLKSRLETNYLFFTAYALSLIFLLCSLRFLFQLSRWPLANMFLGALVFRGILALEVFLNAPEVNSLLDTYLLGVAPPMLITPIVFGAMGILLILNTLLAHLAWAAGARSRRNRDD